MRVLLKSNIFQKLEDDSFLEIKYLLYLSLYRTRHKLYYDGVITKQMQEFFTEDELLLLRQAYVNASNEDVGYDCIVTKYGYRHDHKPYFTVEEAIYYLGQPVAVVLENNRNDAKFIDALIRCYGREQLFDAQRNHWLCYMNAGGCSNVRNVLEAMLASNFDRIKFLRCYVILDSDKFAPNHVNLNAVPTPQYLSSKRIPYHVLEKRMMENYLPDEALPEGQWKNAYCNMTELQKDFYNIAEGFEKDEKFNLPSGAPHDRTTLPIEQQVFYQHVSAINYSRLYHGAQIPNFKKCFPDFFGNSDTVNYNTLQQRIAHQGNPNELKDLLCEIEKLL